MSFNNKRFLGVFVNPYVVQSEGLENVFKNLEKIGANAIAISPRVGRKTSKDNGTRIPILHKDGFRRKLSRPVWNETEFYIEYFSSINNNFDLYKKTKYKPTLKNPPGDIDIKLPFKIINEANKRGVESYLHLQPFIPPNLRNEDLPVYPDGKHSKHPKVTLFGSPASNDIREYGKALVIDCINNFKNISGIFIDWTEYGAYEFEDIFGCFDFHNKIFAIKNGYNWDLLKKQILSIWDKLHHLKEKDLLIKKNPLNRIINQSDGWNDLVKLKSDVITSYYREIRNVLDFNNGKDVKLMARGWSPPWNQFSGLDYSQLAKICNALTPKLFTFDYCALPRWYGETIKKWNPNLSENMILNAVIEWLDLPDNIESRQFSNYYIPDVNEKHPAGVDVYKRKIETVISSINGDIKICPFAHAHMPDEMWKEKIVMLKQINIDGFWIQMYSYLSDNKMRILIDELNPVD